MTPWRWWLLFWLVYYDSLRPTHRTKLYLVKKEKP